MRERSGRRPRPRSAPATLAPGDPPEMPVRSERCRAGGAAGSASSAPSGAAASSLVPPPPINTAQPGVATSLLYSGAKFRGQQRSKGNAYEVEVVMQVRGRRCRLPPGPARLRAPQAALAGPASPVLSGRGRRSRALPAPSGPGDFPPALPAAAVLLPSSPQTPVAARPGSVSAFPQFPQKQMLLCRQFPSLDPSAVCD